MYVVGCPVRAMPCILPLKHELMLLLYVQYCNHKSINSYVNFKVEFKEGLYQSSRYHT